MPLRPRPSPFLKQPSSLSPPRSEHTGYPMYAPPYYQHRGRPRPQQGGGRRNNDSYLIYVLISTCFRHLSELEYKPPITIGLLALNILVHILPELFLPWGVDFRSVRGICLQPAQILELLLPSFSYFSIFDSSSGRGGRGGGSSSWGDLLWKAATGTPSSTYSSSSSSSWWSVSTYDRWHEGLSRIYLSALVHGDDIHLYCTFLLGSSSLPPSLPFPPPSFHATFISFRQSIQPR